jgi:tRNA-uridine 2-sulfurtransferase
LLVGRQSEYLQVNNLPIKSSIAVLMSGGVDSSVAAALLVEAGHRVVGFTLKLWDAEDDEHAKKVCCTVTMARDASRVCGLLGIPHYTLDLREDFRHEVIERFESDYLLGRTPNPCVHCNSRIKWGRVWQKAQVLGLEYIATGHYARIKRSGDGAARLRRGIDTVKDQSYFLWEIPREMLNVTVFPLGELTKQEVRAKARQLNLPVAEKEESQDVCFIPRDDYRAWLQSRHPEFASGELAGEMIDEHGRVLGRHEGYPLFTIGQRKGLGLGGGSQTLFVTKIDSALRRVHVGPKSDLLSTRFRVGQVNRLTPNEFNGGNGFVVKVRYHDLGTGARVQTVEEGLEVITERPLEAVTPGQSAVIYRDDEVVAGGIIL